MVTLRLFHVTDPFRPIETRTFMEGEIDLGRDPAAGWTIEDTACEVSRRHCRFRFDDGVAFVSDLSANGVFIGDRKRRLQRDQEHRLSGDEAIYLGQFLITVEMADVAVLPANDCGARDGAAMAQPFHAPMLQEPLLSADDFQIRGAWARVAADGPPIADAPWLEAFCAGAGIDPSSFAGEDPVAVAERAGAAYRQAVLGICDLLGERGALKAQFDIDRTTIGTRDNNPCKWAEPHRVAVDLLRADTAPFLSGEAAVKASFEDLKKHLLCVMAGSRAAVAAAFNELAPAAIEAEAKGQTALFKSEACWRAFQARHRRAVADAHEDAQGPISRAFRAAYEAQLRAIDGLATRP